MSGAGLAHLRQKMRKRALKLGRKLIPAVKISTDNQFTRHVRMPYEEHLSRREDECNLTTYSIPTDWSYFRVFITNSSNKQVVLFPVRIDERGRQRELPSITVQPHQEGMVPLNIVKADTAADGMQILDADGFMLLELRFRGVPARDEFHKAAEYQHAISDDEYFSAEEGRLPEREPTPVSAPAIVPQRSYRAAVHRKNQYDPTLMLGGTRAQFDRMHALLG